MITATCHCGAVRIDLPAAPERVAQCNCSICRRLGTLWAYYPPALATVAGETDTYKHALAFHRCRVCGCATHWQSLDPARTERMGVNARLLEPADLAGATVRLFDGAESWTYIG